MEPELSELSASIRVLADRVELLVTYQRDITRWLLIVVCVIALGRSALDLGKSMMHEYVSPAKAVEEK